MPFPEYRRNKSESNPQPIYGAVHKLSYVFAMFFPAGYTVQKKFPNIRAESRYGKLCSCNRYLSSKIVLFLKSKIPAACHTAKSGSPWAGRDKNSFSGRRW